MQNLGQRKLRVRPHQVSSSSVSECKKVRQSESEQETTPVSAESI